MDWTEDDMDKVVCLIFSDDRFIAKCVKKGVVPALFSSGVRRRAVEIAYDYYDRYQRAPKDDTVDLIADAISRSYNAEEDLPLFDAYLKKSMRSSRKSADMSALPSASIFSK